MKITGFNCGTGAHAPRVQRIFVSFFLFSLLFTSGLASCIMATDLGSRASSPTNLIVTVVPSGRALNISWDPNTDSPVNYSVYFNVNQNMTPMFLANISHPTTWLYHTGLINGGTYSYWVSAWKKDIESPLTGPVNGTPTDSVAPAVPSDLFVAPLPQGEALRISWTLNTDDTKKYTIYSNLTGTWEQLLEISHPQNSTTLRELLDEKTYYFRISATDESSNESPQGGTRSATARDTMPPPTPIGIDVKVIAEGSSLNITWYPGEYNTSGSFEDDTLFFTVYFNSSGRWEVIGTTPSEVTYLIHSGLTNGVPHYYNVTASDEVPNESPPSEVGSQIPIDSVPPPRPTLDEVPSLTRKPAGNISGRSQIGTTVVIYKNGVQAASKATGPQGNFRVQVTLSEGHNNISAKAFDSSGNPSEPTPGKDVFLDTVSPVADAGEDLTVEPGLVTLGPDISPLPNGGVPTSGSYDNYGIQSFVWTFQYKGANITLPGSNPVYNFQTLGMYTLTLNVTDKAGNWDIDTAVMTVVDKTPPVLLSSSPRPNDKGINPKDSMVLVFTERIDRYRFNLTTGGHNAQDYYGGGPIDDFTDLQIKIDIGENSKQFTCTPLEGLEYEQKYSLLYAVMDFSGNLLLGEIVFTTMEGSNFTDSDGDGYFDYEDAFPHDASEWLDTDSDGLGNNADPDDDNDGMNDTFEDLYGLNPYDARDASQDPDRDELVNADEFLHGTNPLDDDTDKDFYPDGYEVGLGSDPLDKESIPKMEGGDGGDDGYDLLVPAVLVILTGAVLVGLIFYLPLKGPKEKVRTPATREVKKDRTGKGKKKVGGDKGEIVKTHRVEKGGAGKEVKSKAASGEGEKGRGKSEEEGEGMKKEKGKSETINGEGKDVKEKGKTASGEGKKVRGKSKV